VRERLYRSIEGDATLMLVDAMSRFRDLNPRQVGSEELHRVFAKSAKETL
jgi:hypothetical protein